jgi:hypothetical protein
MSVQGQKAKYSLRANVVCCCPDNRLTATTPPCPFGAMNRHGASERMPTEVQKKCRRRAENVGDGFLRWA